MAFLARALALFASVPYGTGTGKNNTYSYATPDALATILAAGYFNSVRDKVKVNDIVIGMAVADGVGVPFAVKFVSVPTSGNVTCTLVDFASGASVATGRGLTILPFNFNLAELAANGDLLTNYVPGFAFSIEKVDFRVTKPATTAAKAATINLEIGATDLTGGVVALTSANCTPAGAAVAGTAITAANTGTATDSFSIELSGVTAFVEGSGVLLIALRNLEG